MIHSGNLSNVPLRCHMHKIYPKGCTLFSKQKALFLTLRPHLEMETGETITVTVIVRSKSSHSAAHRPVSHAGLKKWIQSAISRLILGDEMDVIFKKDTQVQLRCNVFIWNDRSCELLIDSPWAFLATVAVDLSILPLHLMQFTMINMADSGPPLETINNVSYNRSMIPDRGRQSRLSRQHCYCTAWRNKLAMWAMFVQFPLMSCCWWTARMLRQCYVAVFQVARCRHLENLTYI